MIGRPECCTLPHHQVLFLCDLHRTFHIVVSQNKFTLSTDEDVPKLTSRDIERIISQRKRKKPIKSIAKYFGVSRQRIHTILRQYKRTREIPYLRIPGRKKNPISDDTIMLILDSFITYSLGPVLLEKKIEIVRGIHIPHNTIYQVLLYHGMIEPNMKKRRLSKEMGPIRA